MEIAEVIEKYKNNAVNIAIIIFSLILGYNIYKNQIKNIEALKADIDTQAKKNEVLEYMAGLVKKVNAYKAMLSKKDPSLIENTLSGIAKDANVRISSIKRQPEQAHPMYRKYTFDLTIAADSYHKIGNFISKLEKHGDIYVMDRLRIRLSGRKREPDQPYDKLSATLTISTFISAK